MLVDTTKLVSMEEAEHHFSKIAKMVETDGPVVILKNNKPHFIILSLKEDESAYIEYLDDSKFMEMTEQFSNLYDEALRELAK